MTYSDDTTIAEQGEGTHPGPWPDTPAALLAEAVRNGHETLAFLARHGISREATFAVRDYVEGLEQQHAAALEQERVDAQPELWEACYARAGW